MLWYRMGSSQIFPKSLLFRFSLDEKTLRTYRILRPRYGSHVCSLSSTGHCVTLEKKKRNIWRHVSFDRTAMSRGSWHKRHVVCAKPNLPPLAVC